MPILVHLTSHKNVKKIMRSGIFGVKRNIYCELEGQHFNKEKKKLFIVCQSYKIIIFLING